MAKNTGKLKWCKVRLGNDLNWWVSETSDKVNWDSDGLSVIDPRQADHMMETLSALKEYGLQDSIVENAFFTFAIDKKSDKNTLRIVRVTGSIFDSEQYFLLPNNLDDESSPYAEFLDHITSLQIKMLNNTFKFEEKLAIEDLEDEIREKYHNDYMEGKAIHAFPEVMDILEYVPEGYSLDDEEEDFDKDEKDEEEESYDDIDDLPSEDENIEEDETMHWDDEEEGEEEEPYDDFKDDGFGDDEY
ncbi:MAG: hypothetical protein J6T16_06965 [Opitutales bacterium]|nr:hypothetical protein [Opitutales bacterium]